MGLDTRGLADGFMKGYSFVDGINRRDRAEERQDTRDAENAGYRDRQFGLQERSAERADEQLELSRERNEQAQANSDRSFGLQKSNQQFQQNKYNQAEKRQTDADQEKKDKESITSAYQRLHAGGSLNPEDMQLFEKYPHLSPLNFLDQKVSGSIKYMADAIQSGNVNTDEKILRFANTPQSLDSFNAIYGRQVNKGEGGDKQIVGVYPGSRPGMLAFELEITKPDGTKYRAPMTANRGVSGDDDDIKEVNIGDVSTQLYGFNTLNMLTQNLTPEVKQQLNQFATSAGMVNKSSGKREYLDPRTQALVKVEQDKIQSINKALAGSDYDDSGSPIDKDALRSELSAATQSLNSLLGTRPQPKPKPSGDEYSAAQEEKISSVMSANNGKDRKWAIAYLQHINQWN